MLTWWGIMLDVVDFHRFLSNFFWKELDSLNFCFRTVKFVVVRTKTSIRQWKVN